MSSTHIRRRINAPRASVYRALLDVQAVTQWKVPTGMTSRVHEFEGREGGRFRISLTYDEPTGTGKTSAHTDTYHGRFVKLVPEERVVEVVEFETADPALQGEMTIAISLAETEDGGTEVLAVHDGLPPGLSPADNETGWRISLAQLAALVESGEKPLAGRVALVAGASRGAGRGIAVQLGAAGATVYCTGRTTRTERSEMNRPETIEETAALVDAAGGRGIAVQVDHLVPGEVRALVARIEKEQGALHVLVNDIFGATHIEWNKTVWESDLEYGLHLLRLAVETHAITSHFAIPLLLATPGGLVVEVNDGTVEYNDRHYRNSFFYDLTKAAVGRMGFSLGHELGSRGATAVSLTPGWLRSEAMLEAFGVTEANWRDAVERIPGFAISETPAFVGRAVVALARDPQVSRWNGQSLSSGQLARIYGFTDLDGSQPDCWRYLVEVEDTGQPADVTGYR